MSVINKAAALERLDGDEELYQEILNVFKEDTPNTFRLLEDSIRGRNQTEAERVAHSLKSASGSVGADQMRETAFKLELAAKAGNWSECDEVFLTLQHDYLNLKKEF